MEILGTAQMVQQPLITVIRHITTMERPQQSMAILIIIVMVKAVHSMAIRFMIAMALRIPAMEIRFTAAMVAVARNMVILGIAISFIGYIILFIGVWCALEKFEIVELRVIKLTSSEALGFTQLP